MTVKTLLATPDPKHRCPNCRRPDPDWQHHIFEAVAMLLQQAVDQQRKQT